MENSTTEIFGQHPGKTVLITGGTEGTGLVVARELCRYGAQVVLCAEDVTKGEQALNEVRSSVPQALISYEQLDLADLDSVKIFCHKFLLEHDTLDVLINNAEILTTKERINSAQGHELLFAKNFLSHFVLTARLSPLLEQTQDSRIVFQSSPELEKGVIDFFDLDAAHYFDSKKAFAQSKLALLIFAKELDRRYRESDIAVKSIPVQTAGPSLLEKILPFRQKHGFEQASLPILFAVTSGQAQSGNFYGPIRHLGKRAFPVELDTPVNAKNIYAAEKLWEIAEELGGTRFAVRNMSNVLSFQMRGKVEPELFT